MGGAQISKQAAFLINLVTSKLERFSHTKIKIQQLNSRTKILITLRKIIQKNVAMCEKSKKNNKLSINSFCKRNR